MSLAHPALLHGLDAKRIVGTSFTIAAHVAVVMLLLMPVEWTPPERNTVVVVPRWDPPKKIVRIDPPKPETKPRPITNVTPKPQTVVQETVIEQPVVSDVPSDIVAIDYPPFVPIDEPPSGPVALTVIDSPAPPYPAIAIRQNVTGRVLLLIEVDASGRPVSGVIERSSGSTLLDKVALKTVLAKWRFQPAVHNGQPIAATARVPIVFTLDQ